MNVVATGREPASSALRGIVAGIWRFTLVSLAGFAPWIVSDGLLRRHLDEALLYALCLLDFLAAALVLLPGLLVGDARIRRTAQWFLPAFTAYAVVWCACWFTFGGRIGEWTGALAGGTAFTLLAVWALGRPRSLTLTVLVVVAFQVLGYFGGGALMTMVSGGGHPGMSGMAAWGLGYGIGFGAGIGWLTHTCRHTDTPDCER